MTGAENRKPFWVERRSSEPPPVTAGSEGPVLVSENDAEMTALREEISALRADIASLSTTLANGTTTAAMDNFAPLEPEIIDHGPTASPGQEDVHAVQWEIAQLVKSIGRAKSEIAAIRHPMSEDDRLVAASSELDAIVKATEVATNDILSAAEAIELESVHIAGLCNENHEALNASERIVGHVMSILEACNFQDITGQRINKVVQTVHFIETRVGAMIDIWGAEAFQELPMPEGKSEDGDSDADLLNGPQLANEGISQADIDALFD